MRVGSGHETTIGWQNEWECCTHTTDVVLYAQSVLDCGCLRGNKVCFLWCLCTEIKAIHSRKSANVITYSLRFAPTKFWCHKNEEARLTVRPWYEKHTPCVELGVGWSGKVRSDNCQTWSIRQKIISTSDNRSGGGGCQLFTTTTKKAQDKSPKK